MPWSQFIKCFVDRGSFICHCLYFFIQGYDLTRLFIGSEATLGVITEATLRLHNIPKCSYALRVSFKDVADAASAARDTLTCGVAIGRCELLDTTMVKAINQANESLKWAENPTLLYEITGPSVSSVQVT